MVQPCHYKVMGPKKVCGTLCPPMDFCEDLWCAIVLYHAVPYCGPKNPKISQGKALVFFGALAKTLITKGIERPNAGTLAFCSALSDPFHSVASPGDMLVGPQLPVRPPRISSLLWAPGGRCYHIG